jgi:hypothetical protein
MAALGRQKFGIGNFADIVQTRGKAGLTNFLLIDIPVNA